MIFVFLCILYFIIGGLELFDIPISKKVIGVIALFPAFFLTAFRDTNVGCDTCIYLHCFHTIENFHSLTETINSMRHEFGYVFVEYLFIQANLTFYDMQFCISLFFYISLYLFLVKYSKNIGISCFLFLTLRYMFGPMNVVRMYIALAILLYSIPFVQKRNFFKFALLVLLASAFHKTASIFILLYPLSIVNLSKNLILLSFSCAGILSFWGKGFFQLIINNFGLYESYLDRAYLNFSGNIAVYIILLVDICLAIFFFFNKSQNSFSEAFNNYISIEKICFSAILFVICCDIIGFSFTLMNRLSDFFSFFWLISIPLAFMQIKNKIIAVISLLIVEMFLFAYFQTILTLRPNWNCIEPYHFYF